MRGSSGCGEHSGVSRSAVSPALAVQNRLIAVLDRSEQWNRRTHIVEHPCGYRQPDRLSIHVPTRCHASHGALVERHRENSHAYPPRSCSVSCLVLCSLPSEAFVR